ncbi:NACHT domain-containing protein [Komagataeibacter sp. NFXK3]
MAKALKGSSKSAKSSGTSRKTDSKRRVAGGAATGGGINFQAAVTTIAFSYLLRGRPLKWVEGLHDDVPVSVAAETGGSGDDIRLLLRGGKICEIQVKRGLQSGEDLWKSLIAMGRAIAEGATDFAVLAVSPTSSQTIRQELATAIVRIGEGRTDNLPTIATTFLNKVTAEGLNSRTICRAMRIVTVSAMQIDGASIAAAQAELGHVCRTDDQIQTAWNILYRDAVELIDRRGQRELSSLVQLLRTNEIKLSDDNASPAALLDHLSEWTQRTNATFGIFGVSKSLRLDKAWIPLQAIVRDDTVHPVDLKAAVLAYQSWHDQSYSRDAMTVDPETLGRFIKLVVLVAGPGMGKTTLLSRIAHRYAAAGTPVLRVRLSMVAARMRSGSTFEEAVFALGLDGSGVSPGSAISAAVRNWVVLCDGLDETGTSQADIAAAAERFAEGHPECRVIVTTRPVGYHASNLRNWRHYDIMPLESSAAPTHLALLLREIGGEGSDLERKALTIATAELQEETAATVVSRSPLLLALGASVIARGGLLGASRLRLYERLFALVDDAPNMRIPDPPAQPAMLRCFLDALAWQVVADPIAPVDAILRRCANTLVEEAGLKPLVAMDLTHIFLRYWQDVGLVERIGQGDVETLIFIHKTFGEFAAGRRLAAMLPAARMSALLAIGTDDAWDEVLSFAALIGIADDVCTHLLTATGIDATDVARIAHCLEICGEAQAGPSDIYRKRIFDRAFEIVCSPRQEWAIEVGMALVPAARRYPDEVAPRFQLALANDQSWTRLVSWAALAASGPPFLDLDRLKSIIVTEPQHADDGIRPSPGGGVLILKNTERDIAQLFVLEAGRQLLEHRPGQATDEVVATAFRLDKLNTVGFAMRAARVLAQYGKTYNLWSEQGFEAFASLFGPNSGYMIAQRKSDTALLDAIDPSGVRSAAPHSGTKLLCLSAFMQLCGCLELPVSDVWAWTYPFDPAVVQELVRVAIAASRLDPKLLEDDVRAARAGVVNEGTLASLCQVTSHVDVEPMDWKAALQARPDAAKIEAALYHSSQWVIQLAANLLHRIADDRTKRAIILRMIEHGKGKTLRAAARWAIARGNPDVLRAIYMRLSQNPSPGCEHLVRAIPKLDASLSEQLLLTLEICFLRGTVKTAVAAAEIAVKLAAPGHMQLLLVLERAAGHWKINEDPYPTHGGVIPESPRDKIAEASAVISAPDYNRLKLYVSDSRSDVREIGTKMLVERLREQGDLASTFLTDIEEGRLAAHMLDNALAAGMDWDEATLARIETLLASPQVELCYSAMALLRAPYRAAEIIREQAMKLAKHSDSPIRERAYRILDGAPEPA